MSDISTDYIAYFNITGKLNIQSGSFGDGSITTSGNVNIGSTKYLKTDNITSTTTNGNLTINANGTGSVVLNDSVYVSSGNSLYIGSIQPLTSSDSINISDASNTGFLLLNGNTLVDAGKYLQTSNIKAQSNSTLTINTNMSGNIDLNTGTNGNINLNTGSTGGIYLNGDSYVSSGKILRTGIIDVIPSSGNIFIYSNIYVIPNKNIFMNNPSTIEAYDLTVTNQLYAYTITSASLNANLTISANGTGSVVLNRNVYVSSGNILYTNTLSSTTTNGNLTISADGTGSVVLNDSVYVSSGNILRTNTLSSTTTNGNLTISADGTGSVVLNDSVYVSSGNILRTNTLSSTTTNGNLTISADGTGSVVLNDNVDISSGNILRTNTIKSFTTNGNLNINANGTGSVVISPSGSANTYVTSNIIMNTSITDIYSVAYAANSWDPKATDFAKVNITGTAAYDWRYYRKIGKLVFCSSRITGLSITAADVFTYFTVEIPVNNVTNTNSVYASNCIIYFVTNNRLSPGSIIDYSGSQGNVVTAAFDPRTSGSTNYIEVSFIYESVS